VTYDLAAPEPRRTAGTVIRYVLGLLVGAVVLILLFSRRGDLTAARHQLHHLDLGWTAAAVLAESASVAAFAVLQYLVLRLAGARLSGARLAGGRLAGARLSLPGLLALSLANDAIANTVPGEPAVSSAYRYRYYRQRGASSASAGWTIFTMLIALALGMSLLLLVGVLVALLASKSAGTKGAAAAGLVIVVAAGAVLVRRDLVLRLIAWLVRGWRRAAKRPQDGLTARAAATLTRMREIPLRTSAAAGIVALATAVWACDFLCLLCSFGTVHAAIPWAGVLLAYGAAQVVGSLPIVPGGFGIIEGSLAVILVGYGASRVPAVSAAVAYRVVSFWLVIAVGWLAVGVITHRSRRLRQRGAAEAGVQQPTGLPSD
jgi:putative heme transporter